MKSKITLITPPDFYENLNISLLFVNIKVQDQISISEWLGGSEVDEDINIYFFEKGQDLPWLLYAASAADYKFIDLDSCDVTDSFLIGYLLAKPNTFYTTSKKEILNMLGHINQNHVDSVDTFLERVFNNHESPPETNL